MYLKLFVMNYVFEAFFQRRGVEEKGTAWGLRSTGAMARGRAVEGDDWSHVIGQQSLEAVGQPPPEPSEPQAHQPEVKSQPVTTPFARAAVHRSIGIVLGLLLTRHSPFLLGESPSTFLDYIKRSSALS